MKNKNYISWDEYFMGIATLSARRSKDPSRQVGCCIVDQKTKHIVSIGYNGLPYGFDDNEFPWEKSVDFQDDKNSFVVHAEANAILNATTNNLEDCIVYVTTFPCNECSKLLAQKRISKVIYLNDYERHPEKVAVSKEIFGRAGIIVEQYIPKEEGK